MSRKHREPCGCVSDDRQWLVMCEPCRIEWHTRHVQAAADHRGATVTGRVPASAPNLQSIPIRTPEGRRIREAFIEPVSDEYAWLDAPPDSA